MRASPGLAGVVLIADGGARFDVGADVEQGREVGCIRCLAAGQIDGDDAPRWVRFGVIFVVNPTREQSIA